VVSFKRLLHYDFEKQPPVLTVQETGSSKSQSRHHEEKETLLALLGIEPQITGYPACRLVAVPAEQSEPPSAELENIKNILEKFTTETKDIKQEQYCNIVNKHITT
jgi:hypothetical protein